MTVNWLGIVTALSNVKDFKWSTLPTLLVSVGAAAGGHYFWPGDPELKSPLSEARVQMLENGVVGKPTELHGKVVAVISAHFAEKGFPCDPITKSGTVGETMERAKACAVTPSSAPTPPK